MGQRVEVVRRGGFAGIALGGAVDTAELGESSAAVESALAGLRFGAKPAAPRHPDGFRYEISMTHGGRRRRAHLDESELPAELRPLVDAALARGGPIPRGTPGA